MLNMRPKEMAVKARESLNPNKPITEKWEEAGVSPSKSRRLSEWKRKVYTKSYKTLNILKNTRFGHKTSKTPKKYRKSLWKDETKINLKLLTIQSNATLSAKHRGRNMGMGIMPASH